MTSGIVIGLDVGTTGCKAAVIDANGSFLAEAMREYPVLTGPDNKAEQDASLVFSSCRSVIAEAVAKSGAREIDALSYSVQGDAVIPADENFEPVHNAVLGMDYRPAALCEEVSSLLPRGVLYERTGMPLHPINSALKIMWLARNADMAKTARYLTYSDFLAARLSGECVIDECMASRTMLYGLESRAWDDDILNALSIPKAALSRVVESGAAVGRLCKSLCDEFGLARAPIVVAGAHDQPCGALGAGISREGEAVDSLGTAEVLSAVFGRPRLSERLEAGSFPCYRHAWPGFFFTFALNHTSGIILRWFRDVLCAGEAAAARREGVSFYEYIQRNMSDKPSSVVMLPHFSGRGTPNANTFSKGCFAGLTLDTTKADMFKGIMDSLSYELCVNIEYLRAAGIGVDSLRCIGGGAQSAVWLQSKADILGIKVDVPKTSECACLGAGILAACGAGLYKSLAEAVPAMTGLSRSFYPRDETRAAYMEKYAAFRELYRAMDAADRLL